MLRCLLTRQPNRREEQKQKLFPRQSDCVRATGGETGHLAGRLEEGDWELLNTREASPSLSLVLVSLARQLPGHKYIDYLSVQ